MLLAVQFLINIILENQQLEDKTRFYVYITICPHNLALAIINTNDNIIVQIDTLIISKLLYKTPLYNIV